MEQIIKLNKIMVGWINIIKIIPIKTLKKISMIIINIMQIIIKKIIVIVLIINKKNILNNKNIAIKI